MRAELDAVSEAEEALKLKLQGLLYGFGSSLGPGISKTLLITVERLVKTEDPRLGCVCTCLASQPLEHVQELCCANRVWL